MKSKNEREELDEEKNCRLEKCNLRLVRAGVEDAAELHAMQVKAFQKLLDKYQDFDTNPGAESVEKVEARLRQDGS